MLSGSNQILKNSCVLNNDYNFNSMNVIRDIVTISLNKKSYTLTNYNFWPTQFCFFIKKNAIYIINFI